MASHPVQPSGWLIVAVSILHAGFERGVAVAWNVAPPSSGRVAAAIDVNSDGSVDVETGFRSKRLTNGDVAGSFLEAQDINAVAGVTEPREDTTSKCCSTARRLGIRSGVNWGNASTEEQVWYAANCQGVTCHADAMLQGGCCQLTKKGTLTGPTLEGQISFGSDDDPAFIFRQAESSRRYMRADRRKKAADDASSDSDTDERLRLAVLTSGIRERLLVDELMTKVVASTTQKGTAVDVFLDLVIQPGVGKHWQNEGVPVVDPAIKDMEPADFLIHVHQKSREANGMLAYLRLSETFDKLDPLPNSTNSRLLSYSPCCSDTGLGVLRRLKQWQRMWSEVLQYEKVHEQKYSFVLKTREDSFWAHNFNLNYFLHQTTTLDLEEYQGAVFTKGCAEFSGLSDKVFFMERRSAHKFFSRMYYDYYELRDEKLDKATSAEAYWHQYADLMKLKVVKAPFVNLAVLDGQFDAGFGKTPRLCIKTFYVMDCAPVAVGPGKDVETCNRQTITRA